MNGFLGWMAEEGTIPPSPERSGRSDAGVVDVAGTGWWAPPVRMNGLTGRGRHLFEAITKLLGPTQASTIGSLVCIHTLADIVGPMFQQPIHAFRQLTGRG